LRWKAGTVCGANEKGGKAEACRPFVITHS
jgi:hypothetical protein